MTGAQTQEVTSTSCPVIQRAKGYPYPRPDASFVYVNGHTYLLDDQTTTTWANNPLSLVQNASTGATTRLQDVLEQQGLPSLDTYSSSGFTPILAIGSNASPEQLARKYPLDMFPAGVVIPVLRCVLEDFDVVYAPTLAGYGSCPATLQHCPGTRVQVFITYLTAPLAARLHATEGGYDLLSLSGIRLHVGCGLTQLESPLTSILLYNHSQGCLTLPWAIIHSTSQASKAQPHPCQPSATSASDASSSSSSSAVATVAIAEIPALGRTLPALSQQQVLQALQLLMAAGGSKACGSSSGTDIHVRTVAADPSIMGSAEVVGAAVWDVSGGDAAGLDGVVVQPAGAVKQVAVVLEDWILQHVHDADVRRQRVQVLRGMRQGFAYQQVHKLQEL